MTIHQKEKKKKPSTGAARHVERLRLIGSSSAAFEMETVP